MSITIRTQPATSLLPCSDFCLACRWNYLGFIAALKLKPADDYTGMEQYVGELLDGPALYQSDFMPVGICAEQVIFPKKKVEENPAQVSRALNLCFSSDLTPVCCFSSDCSQGRYGC